jgi:Phosphotransferase enzyme family
VAYVLAPPRWRLRIKRLLYSHSLSMELSIVHLPDQAASRYLVPLSPAPIRYAISKLLPIPRWGRSLAATGLRLPGVVTLVENSLPSVGLVARHPGARPLFDWLFQLDQHAPGGGSAVIRTSWRGRDGAIVLYRFLDCDAQPSAIAKLNLTTAMAGNRVAEATALAHLGPSAGSAGARIPRPLLLGERNDSPVLLQTVVSGQPLASVLASRPNRLLDIIKHLIVWLERWNRSTMTIKPLDPKLLDRELLAPAALLAPLLDHGGAYRNWLTEGCAALVRVPVALVAAHNDLTMWNVLLDEQGRLGVLDWESACEACLPLVDFFYGLTDAVAAAQGYFDRGKAFEACFALDGTYAPAVRQFLKPLRDAVEISDEMAELCFHACWLHHAANEHRAAVAGAPRPFFKIVQQLALHRHQFRWWLKR